MPLARAGAFIEMQKSGTRVHNHPRVSRFSLRGNEYIGLSARPGALGSERFARERRMSELAAKIVCKDGTYLAPAPEYSGDTLIVHKAEDAQTLHDKLTAHWSQEHSLTCGEILASLHSSTLLDAPWSENEEPVLFPLSAQEWANTPDRVLEILATVGHVDVLDGVGARHRGYSSDGPATLIHADFKPDNILVVDGVNELGKSVRVIDWELAGLGNPVEDFGALLAGLTLAALQSEIGDAQDRTADGMHRFVQRATDKTFKFLAGVIIGYTAHCEIEFSGESLFDVYLLRLLARAEGLVIVTGVNGALGTLLIGMIQGLLENQDGATSTLQALLNREGSVL